MQSTEIWKPIPGWEGLYEASDHGRVRSLPRRVSGGNGSTAIRGGRVLKQAIVGDGYLKVTLSRGPSITNARVHRLILAAFRGAQPPSVHGRHADGDPANNMLTNLSWGTPLENYRDKERLGTNRYALNRGHCSKGHAWDEANTYIAANGTPYCRACRRNSMRKKRDA